MKRIAWSAMAGALITAITVFFCTSVGHNGPSVHNVMLFLDLDSFLIVAATAFGLLLFTHGLKTFSFFAACIKIIFAKLDTPSLINAEIAKDAAIYTLAGGIPGCLIGIIKMLATLDDPSKLGVGIAIALLSTLYAAFGSGLVFIPLSKKFSNPAPAGIQTVTAFGMILVPAIGAGLILFGIFMALGITAIDNTCGGTYKESPSNVSIVRYVHGKDIDKVVLTLKDFRGNLKSGNEAPRYIKLNMVIEAHGKDAEAILNEKTSVISNALLTETLSTSLEEGTSSAGMEKLEKRVIEKIRSLLPKDLTIDALYFTGYLVS